MSAASTDWLPPLMLFPDYGGNWEIYEAALYGSFFADFVASRPQLGKQTVLITREPRTNGREYAFWHLISEGPSEQERVPSLRRCERIAWPRPMIEALAGGRVRMWRNRRKSGEGVVLAVEDFSYKVVLVQRRGYVLLWTAYYVEHPHRRRELRAEYETYVREGKS